jgi:hypothetical protein
MANKVLVLRDENRATSIIDSPVTITGAWQDVTDVVFNVKGIEAVGVWFDLTIDSFRDVRFRAVGLPNADSPASEEYNLPIQTVEPDVVKLEPEFFELNVDIDVKMVFQVSIGDLVSYIKLQVMSGNPAGPGVATVNDMLLTVKRRDRG